MDYFKQFQKHILNHDYAGFLALWEEYCLGDEIEPKELQLILETVKSSDLSKPFGRHVENAITLWEKCKDDDIGHEVFKLIIDLQTTNSLELGDLVLSYLKQHYPEAKHFNEKIRLVGLRDKTNFQGAVRNFELLNHAQVGNFVFHTAGWGVGEIMEISFLREQLALEFDYVPGVKDLSFNNAFNTLHPITKDHFLARRFGRPDELEALAKKEPITVVHMMLSDLGPLTASEIKDELAELVIPSQEWQKWWQSTRSKLKKDTFVEVPTELRSPFKLRDKEVSHEEKLYKSLKKKHDANSFIQLIYSFLRDFPTTLKNPDFLESLRGKITEALSTYELSDAQELQLHFFLEDINPEKELTSVAELIKRFQNIEELLHNIAIVAFKKRTLQNVRKHREDWSDIFLNLFSNVEQNPLREYILQELLSGNKEALLCEKIEEILSYPVRSPQALLWYFQKIMGKADFPMKDDESKTRFFEAMLILLSKIEQSDGAREYVKKTLTILTTGRFANVRKIFQIASKEQVQEYLLLASKCQSLTDHDIKILHSLAEVVHPSLKKMRKKKHEEPKEEAPIWTTEEGYQQLKQRIEHIATVETVENAKEIEEARAHGDLRENAEFKAALEKRDRLQSELKMLSDQLNRARILTPQDVPTDSVGVGTRIECKEKDNGSITLTVLGPWEANTEKNILSFQSKLAQDITGKKIGDKISIHGKEYVIEKINNALQTV